MLLKNEGDNDHKELGWEHLEYITSRSMRGTSGVYNRFMPNDAVERWDFGVRFQKPPGFVKFFLSFISGGDDDFVQRLDHFDQTWRFFVSSLNSYAPFSIRLLSPLLQWSWAPSSNRSPIHQCLPIHFHHASMFRAKNCRGFCFSPRFHHQQQPLSNPEACHFHDLHSGPENLRSVSIPF